MITFCVIAFQKKNQLQLTIGTHQISSEEYLACMQSVMYDTKMQIQQQYDVDYDDDFWKKKYGKKYGYEILAENTLESLKYIHAVYDLAVENGYVDDGSYERIKNGWSRKTTPVKRNLQK